MTTHVANVELQWWAYRVYQRALKDHRLERPDRCSRCAAEGSRVDGHHADYARPLAVVWLCRACHRSLHDNQWSHEQQPLAKWWSS